MKQRFCRNLAICSGFALLFLSSVSATAQQVQRNPIVVHATNHATTPLAFRDMAPVPWHNASKVMPRPGRAPQRHISLVPDALIQSEVLRQVGTTSLLNFDGITDAQGGGFVPPDTNASVGATQVVETVNVAYAVYDKTTGAQIMAPRIFRRCIPLLAGSAPPAT
jgi:hypothetical protein